MPRHHFLTNPAVAIAAKPADRWCAAFPEGTWGELASLGEPSTRPDAIWIPVTNPQWAARVTDLSAQPGAPPVIVMSPVPQDAEGLRAINWGARGYCHLYAQPDLLQEVARAVLAGSLWVGPALLDRLVAAASTLLRQAQSSQPGPKDHEAPAPLPDLASLSAREREVADQVAQGKTNKEIARALGITERTVKAHLGSTFEKLKVRDRLQLVLLMSPPRNPGA